MKELNHCSECDAKLTEEDKEKNRKCEQDDESWTCLACDAEAYYG